MPEMDGLETVAIIRENAAFAQVPVLLLSSADRAGYSARSRSLGIARSLTQAGQAVRPAGGHWRGPRSRPAKGNKAQ